MYLGSMNYLEKGSTEEERYSLRIKNCKMGIVAVFIVYCAHRVFDENIQEMFQPYHRLWKVFANIC
jgi:putative NADPH-quinone reductase